MDVLKIDLLNVCYAYGVFLLAYIANILFSIYYNVKINGEDFNKYTLLNSLKKAVVFVLATLALVVAVDAAITYFAAYVPELSDVVRDTVTVLMVTGTIGRAAIKYIAEAYNTFINVLNGKPTEVVGALNNKE